MTDPPFQKILIANRGEIAVRVIRACREMGIVSVAIYSEPDAAALHVGLADEAYLVGPAPTLQSYLDANKIIEVAVGAGAQAIHPGYGFLAENPDFARLVVEAGLTWIGPPAEVIRLLGDKLEAKRLALAAGVPVVPGFDGDAASGDELAAAAERIGYPVMIKAAAGGGGKGMRMVESPGQLREAAAAAGREAAAAFGDSRIFLEKALSSPRHIEIQVFADALGNAIHLGERECSVQRRHQKVLEESPSPVLTSELRTAMGEAALRVVRASGYVNAGTVEFLFSSDAFYFLEVNTRIQVEHPVTEMVTGLDLVRMQIDVAAGKPLPLAPLDVARRGHAIEARLYAEDPSSGFLPATGRLSVFRPPTGAGIRNDVGVETGSAVTPHYDPILAKLIVHAEDREAAVARLRAALEDYGVLGVTTNQAFLHWVATSAEFVAGRADTGFIDREWKPAPEEEVPSEVILLTAALESHRTPTAAPSPSPWTRLGGWRVSGAARRYRYRWRDQPIDLDMAQTGVGVWSVKWGDVVAIDVRLDASSDGSLGALWANGSVRGFGLETADYIDISWKGRTFRLSRPELLGGSGGAAAGAGAESLTAPMPGTVIRVLVQPGQSVSAHEPLMVMEAMKMEHVIEAPHSGTVRDIHFAEGDMVPAGSPLVRLEE